MKGNWDGFSGGGGSTSSGSDGNGNGYVNGTDYNTAGSSSVGQVDSVTTFSNAHSMPLTSSPNSVTKNYRDGKLSTERYYGSDGKPYLDIDYSDHGNAKMHPYVPHEHKISFKGKKMIRDKTDGRIK
jgi:hypothetical protein